MEQTNYQKELKFKVASVDKEQRIIKGVFSTMAEDRHGEVVDQLGWNLKEYMLNPVVLFGHDHNRPAIGKALNLLVGQSGLEGEIQFAETPFAQEIFSLYEGGYMSAFSCGFRNDVYEYNTEEDKVVLRENTLYEISCVNVPANAYALAKAKGLELKEVANPLGKLEIAKKVGGEDVKPKDVVSEKEADELKAEITEVVAKAIEAVPTAKVKSKKDLAIALVNKACKSLVAKKMATKN
jgi:HK97 family phage prohead protease